MQRRGREGEESGKVPGTRNTACFGLQYVRKGFQSHNVLLSVLRETETADQSFGLCATKQLNSAPSQW